AYIVALHDALPIYPLGKLAGRQGRIFLYLLQDPEVDGRQLVGHQLLLLAPKTATILRQPTYDGNVKPLVAAGSVRLMRARRRPPHLSPRYRPAVEARRLGTGAHTPATTSRPSKPKRRAGS